MCCSARLVKGLDMDGQAMQEPAEGANVASEKSNPTATGEGRWRKSPEILRMLGLTEEDVRSPLQAMLKEGLSRLWKVRSAMQVPLEFSGAVPVELQEKEEDFAAKKLANDWKCAGLHLPLWQVISGLEPEQEVEMSPEQRERAIKTLLAAVIHLLRYEMEQAEKNKDEWRSFMWDPLPKICFYLGISRAKLTRFTKEVMGLSAHELVDGLRVQELRARMKEALRSVVGFALQNSQSALDVWRRLKAARKAPKWDRQTWAIGLGFPNYARMYRACLVIFGKTPAQVEFEVIEELCVTSAVEKESTESTKVQFFAGEGVGSTKDEVRSTKGVETTNGMREVG